MFRVHVGGMFTLLLLGGMYRTGLADVAVLEFLSLPCLSVILCPLVFSIIESGLLEYPIIVELSIYSFNSVYFSPHAALGASVRCVCL